MARNFQRTVEDFTCSNCHRPVVGDGYTNHCPHCLWSQHVDNKPGDREHGCRGQMEPIGVIQKHGNYRLKHRCLRCGVEKFVNSSPNDSFEMLLKVAAQNGPLS